MAPKRRTRGQHEGSIYQRSSDGKWVASLDLGWQDGKRKRKYFYGATRSEAAGKLTEALGKQQRGEPVAFTRQTVTPFLRRWHAEVIVPNRRAKTVETYRYAIERHLIPAVGDRPLARLSAQDVQGLLTRCRTKGLAPNTIAGILSVLKLALDQAKRLELVERNVATLVDRPRIPRHEPNPLPPDEARRLLETVADDRLTALYEVSVRLGLRQGEALGLRWRDVDLDDGSLRVRQQLQRVGKQPVLVPPKSDRSRRPIELTPPLVSALRAHRARQRVEREQASDLWQDGSGWDLVFRSRRGAPLWPSHLREHLRDALARAGLERRCWHELRHTAITLMHAGGVPERTIMEIMGHATLSMSRQYGSILPASRRDALSRVDDLLRPSSAPVFRARTRRIATNGCKRRLHSPNGARAPRAKTRAITRQTTRDGHASPAD